MFEEYFSNLPEYRVIFARMTKVREGDRPLWTPVRYACGWKQWVHPKEKECLGSIGQLYWQSYKKKTKHRTKTHRSLGYYFLIILSIPAQAISLSQRKKHYLTEECRNIVKVVCIVQYISYYFFHTIIYLFIISLSPWKNSKSCLKDYDIDWLILSR